MTMKRASLSIIFVCSLLGASAQNSVAPEASSPHLGTVIIRVLETHTPASVGFKKQNAGIYVHGPGSETQQIPLDNDGNANIDANLSKIKATFDDFIDKGFQLISTSCSGGDMTSSTTWIFEKER